MGQLTIKEFIRLSDEEKRKRYEELSPHDKFLWRTSYEPIVAKSIGRVEIPEEERMKARKAAEEFMKKWKKDLENK